MGEVATGYSQKIRFYRETPLGIAYPRRNPSAWSHRDEHREAN